MPMELLGRWKGNLGHYIGVSYVVNLLNFIYLFVSSLGKNALVTKLRSSCCALDLFRLVRLHFSLAIHPTPVIKEWLPPMHFLCRRLGRYRNIVLFIYRHLIRITILFYLRTSFFVLQVDLFIQFGVLLHLSELAFILINLVFALFVVWTKVVLSRLKATELVLGCFAAH